MNITTHPNHVAQRQHQGLVQKQRARPQLVSCRSSNRSSKVCSILRNILNKSILLSNCKFSTCLNINTHPNHVAQRQHQGLVQRQRARQHSSCRSSSRGIPPSNLGRSNLGRSNPRGQPQGRHRPDQAELKQPAQQRLERRCAGVMVSLTKTFILRQYLLYWSVSTLYSS